MPMTRELKKRLIGIDERIEKLEKKPTQQTNGEDLGDSPGDVESRLENIEAVLQIPGEALDGDIQVLSAWRQIVESKLQNIETVLVMPGGDGFLSGFANKVDQAITGVKEQVKELHEKWKPLFNVGKWIDKTEGRLTTLEEIPDPSSEESPTVRQLESLKKRMRGSEEQHHTVLYHGNTLKDHQDRLLKLEQIIRSDFPIKVFGKPFTEWIKNTGDRIEELERKPVAGTLSNIAQDMQLDIEGATREVKELRSLIFKAIWIVSVILAIMTVGHFLANVLP